MRWSLTDKLESEGTDNIGTTAGLKSVKEGNLKNCACSPYFSWKKMLFCAIHKTGHRKPTIMSNALCIHKFYHLKELPLPASFTYYQQDCMPAGTHCPIHPPTSEPFNKFHFQQRNSFLKWRHKQLLQISNAYLASARSPIQKHTGYDPLIPPFHVRRLLCLQLRGQRAHCLEHISFLHPTHYEAPW